MQAQQIYFRERREKREADGERESEHARQWGGRAEEERKRIFKQTPC